LGYLQYVSIIFSLLFSFFATQHWSRQETTETPLPWVQVTSVTVEPSTVHKTGADNLIVQILLWGEPPPEPEIKLEVGTHSSDPPDNTVKYDKPTRSVRLHKGVNVEKITVNADSNTRKGTIRIIAIIMGVSKGLNIKPPDSSENCTAKLELLA
jgi:hypothetical protein